jgi:hypothetical protein
MRTRLFKPWQQANKHYGFLGVSRAEQTAHAAIDKGQLSGDSSLRHGVAPHILSTV